MPPPKEKRTKPCSNCKKSKVKCIYTNSLPCERCVKMGQALNCQFVPKLPSLNFGRNPDTVMLSSGLNMAGISVPSVSPMASIHQQPHITKLPNIPKLHPSNASIIPEGNIGMNSGISSVHNLTSNPSSGLASGTTTPRGVEAWRDNMERQMNGFGEKLTDLVDILKVNQSMLQEQQRRQAALEDLTSTSLQISPQKRYVDMDNEYEYEYETKRKRVTYPKDFRDGYLSISEAKDLFNYFNCKISQQLFGFDLSKLSVDDIWDASPILVCAICYISSIHYPEKLLSKKSSQLGEYLHSLCGQVLYQGRPKNEKQGFNIIMALVLCSFWLSDSQMFTGLALQVAKEFGFNKPPNPSHESNGLDPADKMKLWYLLYILDGQQSITFNRQPLVDSQDFYLKNARGLLGRDKKIGSIEAPSIQKKKRIVEGKHENTNEDKPLTSLNQQQDEPSSRTLISFNDMRLVSQVEYNQALNDVFSGNAWDLLAPAGFGIPSKSNLELDKWMVSWTVLLAPVTNGAVWSSKSTLIYYNFAKMHINSAAIRGLQFSPVDQSTLPKLSCVTVPEANKSVDNSLAKEAESGESDDDEDDIDEFVSNSGLISQDQTVVSANIAVGAAETVLNLVINDQDILQHLKYVPVHIHIMLYYAALLLISPSGVLKSNNTNRTNHFERFIENLRVVKKLQKNIYLNLPTDKKFGIRLIKSLDEVIDDRSRDVKKDITEAVERKEITRELMVSLIEEIRSILSHELSDAVQDVDSDSSKKSRGSTPIPEKIYAWPGSNHGHP